MPLQRLYVVRHGETAWTQSRQHTGLTDIPLVEVGERHAKAVGTRLKGLDFKAVFTSPLRRASRTCEIAGFGANAVKDHDLVEWDYGDFEGKTSKEIQSIRPGWALFRDGAPGGESIAQIGARADRFIAKVRGIAGDVIAFSSGHFSRVLVARWLGLDASLGRHFFLDTASVSVLSYEHDESEPVIKLWNETCRD